MTNPEKWKKVCAKAAIEKDPKRLLELVEELNRLLEERDKAEKSPEAPRTQ